MSSSNASLHKAGLYFRGSDAILAIILARTAINAKIGVPVFSCNTSIADRIRQHGRRVHWIDIADNTLKLDPEQLGFAVAACEAIIVHSYWGQPIPELASIETLVRDHGKVLIVDYAHRLVLDEALRNTSTSVYFTFSFSKEVPFLLGGACIPPVCQVPRSLSPLLAARAAMAAVSMSLAARGGFMKRLIDSVNSRRAANASVSASPLPTGGAPRPMSVLQYYLLGLLTMTQRRARDRRARWAHAHDLPQADAAQWGCLVTRADAQARGLRAHPMWPDCQTYDGIQRTPRLLEMMNQNVLCIYERT